MDIFVRKTAYTGPVQSVILDWAGTAVDHGCLGPAAVFVDVFAGAGICVTIDEARQFMGMAKKDHIRSMCRLPSVERAWKAKHGHTPDEMDLDTLYKDTTVRMVDTIANHSDPIEGVVETMEKLRAMDIKIGSSTGYVQEMMDVLVPIAQEKGYHPDAIVCSSDVPAGRPYPWMCFLNAMKLNTYPMEAMVKIGDTVVDIEEGLNAGMWTIGVTRTGNEMGLTPAQVADLNPSALAKRLAAIEVRFKTAGVHYVVEQTADILPVISEINEKLLAGERPPLAG